jgi:hypothetical protein
MARSLGDLFGEVSVTFPNGERLTSPTRVVSRHVFRPRADIVRIGIGPAIGWVVEFVSRATNRPQPGVQVRFTRTGGPEMIPPSVARVSDASGRVTLSARALESGTISGTLEIIPPAPGSPSSIPNFSLEAIDDDIHRLYGVIDVMPYMPYWGVVKIAGLGANEVAVEFRRTGGIPLQEDVVTSRSTEGAFAMRPVPLAQGEVIGDLTIRALAPYPSFVVRGIRMSTVDLNGVPERLLHVWDLDLPPTGPPGTTVQILPP